LMVTFAAVLLMISLLSIPQNQAVAAFTSVGSGLTPRVLTCYR
jgi:hypothetical protein